LNASSRRQSCQSYRISLSLSLTHTHTHTHTHITRRWRVGMFAAGFTGAAREALVAFHVQNGAEVRERGLALDLKVPHFKDLQWRLDVQVRAGCRRDWSKVGSVHTRPADRLTARVGAVHRWQAGRFRTRRARRSC
jgi:hypothetical protein